MKNLTFWIWGAFILAVGCSKSETEEIEFDFGYDYFPLEVGRSYFYQVDSIIFDPVIGGTAVDSSRTFVREDIVDTLLDNTGAVLYRVERFERKNDTLPWTIRKVLTLQQDEQKAVRTEDNLRLTTLVFPVLENQQWPGANAFDVNLLTVAVAGESILMFKDWGCRIVEVDEPQVLGALSFEEVATVINSDQESNIDIRYVREQYARGVGLISRELLIMDTQCIECCGGDLGDGGPCATLPWEEKAEKGFILRQQLIDYR